MKKLIELNRQIGKKVHRHRLDDISMEQGAKSAPNKSVEALEKDSEIALNEEQTLATMKRRQIKLLKTQLSALCLGLCLVVAPILALHLLATHEFLHRYDNIINIGFVSWVLVIIFAGAHFDRPRFSLKRVDRKSVSSPERFERPNA